MDDMKIVIALIFTILLSNGLAAQNNSQANAGKGEKMATDKQQKVKWYTIEEAIALNAKQPRKIIMDVYTDWCGWCKVLDKKTFSHPYIAKYLNENFYPVKFNAEQVEDVVYMGTTYKNRAQGEHSAHDFIIALTQGKLSYPTMIFFDEQSKPLTILPGFQEPQQLEPILVFLVEDRYKTGESFETFLQNFKSKIER